MPNHFFLVLKNFLIFEKFWKTPILVIEVDWVQFHENNSAQSERDKKKNSILEKYNIPYLRLSTNWSWDREKIIEKIKLLREDNEWNIKT